MGTLNTATSAVTNAGEALWQLAGGIILFYLWVQVLPFARLAGLFALTVWFFGGLWIITSMVGQGLQMRR